MYLCKYKYINSIYIFKFTLFIKYKWYNYLQLYMLVKIVVISFNNSHDTNFELKSSPKIYIPIKKKNAEVTISHFFFLLLKQLMDNFLFKSQEPECY